MSLVIEHKDSTDEMLEMAADSFIKLFDETLEKKEFFDVALSGGGTAKSFFGFLINRLIGNENLLRIRIHR